MKEQHLERLVVDLLIKQRMSADILFWVDAKKRQNFSKIRFLTWEIVLTNTHGLLMLLLLTHYCSNDLVSCGKKCVFFLHLQALPSLGVMFPTWLQGKSISNNNTTVFVNEEKICLLHLFYFFWISHTFPDLGKVKVAGLLLRVLVKKKSLICFSMYTCRYTTHPLLQWSWGQGSQEGHLSVGHRTPSLRVPDLDASLIQRLASREQRC